MVSGGTTKTWAKYQLWNFNHISEIKTFVFIIMRDLWSTLKIPVVFTVLLFSGLCQWKSLLKFSTVKKIYPVCCQTSVFFAPHFQLRTLKQVIWTPKSSFCVFSGHASCTKNLISETLLVEQNNDTQGGEKGWMWFCFGGNTSCQAGT